MTSPATPPPDGGPDPAGRVPAPAGPPAVLSPETPAPPAVVSPEAPAGPPAVLPPEVPAAPPTGPSAVRPETEADAEELVRLRAELGTLRQQLDTRRRRRTRAGFVRRTAAAVLVAISAFLLVASVVGVWGARTVLDTDRWVATVAPLPGDPYVSAAVAEYTTTQLFEVVDVEQRLRTALPPPVAFAAGPIAGQLRDTVRRTVTTVLRSDRFAVVWTEVNRQLHQRVLAVVDGTSDVVRARHDRIDIDLLPLVNEVLRTLGPQLPTVFGKQITLPDLSSGAIPANLRLRVQEALGVPLPADFARFTVYDSGQLWAMQQAVATARRDLAVLVAGTVALLIAAYVVSPGRRRTTAQLGVWLVIAAVVVTAVLRAVRRQVLAEVPPGVYHDGVAAAMTSVFGPLRERGTQLLWTGAVLALLAYAAGPGRAPVWARRQIGRGGRAVGRSVGRAAGVATTRGPGFVARHADPLRLGGLAVAVVLALVLSSWTALLVVAAVLAGYEIAVTLMARHRDRPATDGPDETGRPAPA
jgi:hypothetical protein